ncbi:glycoside hydrolase/deacetylase [Pholiota conissans]|uniref:chitin deacetylase n=1 Tax=Pholiota conissans TaxID=109636 RepID=A0A9P5YWV0_9AGAR|nr:glycoside hydrolase/deacetylase [Pholiota conissans]
MFSSFSTLRTILSLGALSVFLSQDVLADRTTEAGEAQVTDPNQECTPYGYPLVSSALATFPPVWEPATIVAGDTAAMAKWNSIQGSVPNIAPKGTLAGDFSSVHYSPTDPDCWWTFENCVTPKAPGLVPDIADMPEPQTLGYGFDDGPNCSHNAFYDYLTSQNQKATMFYIGSNVMDWPLEAQRAITDGHEICVHTWSHNYMTSFESQNAFAELYYTIKLVTGVTPTCWRPPFGDVDDRIRAIAKGLGLRTIIWKYDSDDWRFGSTPGVTQATVDGNYQSLIDLANKGTFATAGAIILTHELNAFTMSEAMKMYPLLKAAFKNIVPVGVGYNVTQPYVETNYTLPSFAQCITTATLNPNSTQTSNTTTVPSGQTAGSSTATGTSAPASTTSTTPKSAASSLRFSWSLWNLVVLAGSMAAGALLC